MKYFFWLVFLLILWSCTQREETEAPQVMSGQKIYQKNCVICHGADGKLQLNGAKDLSVSVLPLDERINQITNGKNLMTPFKGILSEKEIKAVAEYTLQLNSNN